MHSSTRTARPTSYHAPETRPEPRLAETPRAAELAARLWQDSRRVPSCQIPAQIPQSTECHHTAPAIATNMTWIPFLSINREQFRVARNNADLEAVPEGVFIVLSTSMLGKLNGHGKVCQTQFKKTVPCFRRVGRDNQPVVTTYKAYPRSLPPPQIQDTRHRYDHTQQHRRTVQPV